MNIYRKIEKEYEAEFAFDEPVVYNGVKFYPINLRRIFTFMDCVGILCMNKNVISDPKIISMSYLDFLLQVVESDERYLSWLYFIIALSVNDFKVKISYGKDEKNKSFIKIYDKVFYKKEFDFIRKLILVQNVPGYEEEIINPELKRELEEVERIKNGSREECNIEKKIVSIIVGNSMRIEDVYNSTIRKFNIMLEMIDKKNHYIIDKLASRSGFVEFKSEIVHYLVENNASIGDRVIDYNKFQNKIEKANN